MRRLRANVRHDITFDGPELAAHALRAGLVDELQLILCAVVVGAGKRFFPDRVRLKLELVEDRRFRRGVVVLRYARLIDAKAPIRTFSIGRDGPTWLLPSLADGPERSAAADYSDGALVHCVFPV